MCAGTFTVVCPKFISEVAPTEYKGPYGAMSQLMCVSGILAVTLMGLAIPNPITAADASKYDIPEGSYLPSDNPYCGVG
jgi:hypothetical protein